jgi:hypothetical protein
VTPVGREWGSKTLAGALLGLSLALACSAIFARLASGIAPQVRAQLTMWMVMPIWLSALASSWGFESGKRAWRWLALANLAAASSLAIACWT